MPYNAFILGGTGQIGLAICDTLLNAGWEVSVGGRGNRPLPQGLTERGVKSLLLDRDDPTALFTALKGGADALIDVTAYGPAHGRQLLAMQHDVGKLVVLSSSSVYRDGAGRTLDEAAQNGFPDFPTSIAETHATVEPGDATYSTRKVALENLLLDKAQIPLTILRPAAIHGPHSIHPREWWFVKRMLDGRTAIPLAFDGESRFHTSSVRNIAELIRTILDLSGSHILNIADPHAVSVAEIASLIGTHMGFTGHFIPVPDEGFPARVGQTPWSVPRPFILDNSAALTTGYRPVTDYAQAIGPLCDQLARETAAGDWRVRFPLLANYPFALFDYASEDAFFREQSG